MFRSVGKINFAKLEESIPAFLTNILIPLTFSITQGILWGFISHVGLYLIVGRATRPPSGDAWRLFPLDCCCWNMRSFRRVL